MASAVVTVGQNTPTPCIVTREVAATKAAASVPAKKTHSNEMIFIQTALTESPTTT
jgi:hypothetical protein